jgi:hypothetical protein
MVDRCGGPWAAATPIEIVVPSDRVHEEQFVEASEHVLGALYWAASHLDLPTRLMAATAAR